MNRVLIEGIVSEMCLEMEGVARLNGRKVRFERLHDYAGMVEISEYATTYPRAVVVKVINCLIGKDTDTEWNKVINDTLNDFKVGHYSWGMHRHR